MELTSGVQVFLDEESAYSAHEGATYERFTYTRLCLIENCLAQT